MTGKLLDLKGLWEYSCGIYSIPRDQKTFAYEGGGSMSIQQIAKPHGLFLIISGKKIWEENKSEENNSIRSLVFQKEWSAMGNILIKDGEETFQYHINAPKDFPGGELHLDFEVRDQDKNSYEGRFFSVNKDKGIRGCTKMRRMSDEQDFIWKR